MHVCVQHVSSIQSLSDTGVKGPRSICPVRSLIFSNTTTTKLGSSQAGKDTLPVTPKTHALILSWLKAQIAHDPHETEGHIVNRD
jgi:hypothetical protein